GLDTADMWGDGAARREFMYSGDMADAVMFAVNHFDSLPELMNVGMGHDYTISEYYAAVAEVIGWCGSLRHDLTKPIGMRQKLVSVTRQTLLGWTPATSLLEGLTKTYQYYLERLQE
ncbi:MAG: NAD-dependent epimerase/dehydratase family protein, partial [Betaproteobacteria bacterium]|nr:NAD-dependent epimerase/dehydratase family protein [Betaproteobacteria bacterium]